MARSEEAWTRQGLFGSFALTDATYVFTSAQGPSAELLDSRQDLTKWKHGWARAYAPAAQILASIQSFEQILVNEVIRVDCARFYVGQLALLGDAAHAMAPNLGQGGNSALVDAAVLCASLREANSIAMALSRYDARRRPAVRKVADTADRLGQLASWTSPVAGFLRDKMLLPVAQRFSNESAMQAVMQESASELVRLCVAP